MVKKCSNHIQHKKYYKDKGSFNYYHLCDTSLDFIDVFKYIRLPV